MEFDSVVKGGTVTTPDASYVADVGIAEGKIAEIGQGLLGARVIDATGLIVMPGAIDVHTHFATEVGGQKTADDFESGSRAAAAGGITSFINFAFQQRGHSLVEAVEAEYRKAEGRSHLDFGVHAVVTDPASVDLDSELPRLVDGGVSSLKIFTGVEGFELHRREILNVLQAAAAARMIVAVHAEDGALVAHLTSRLLAAGKRAVDHLPEARPAEAEAISTSLVSSYADAVGCQVYFVHLSSRMALDSIRRARSRGARVYVETRPAYLYLDSTRYSLPEREGNKYVCWPPLRTPDDQAALWEGLRNGEIQTYATDHTTWTAAEKMSASTFDQIPGGVSNVQTSIGMLYNEGVKKGRISMGRLVEVCSTNPAKLFGMWPQKGSLAIGSDADLTVIDPNKAVRITSSEMESRSDFDPYEGWQGQGWPTATWSRGELIMLDGKLLVEPGRGRRLKRLTYQPI